MEESIWQSTVPRTVNTSWAGWSPKYSRGQQVALLGNMLEVKDLKIESSDEVRLAAKALSSNKSVQLADCLIGIRNAKSGCTTTKTFDKGAGKLAEFELVQ